MILKDLDGLFQNSICGVFLAALLPLSSDLAIHQLGLPNLLPEVVERVLLD